MAEEELTKAPRQAESVARPQEEPPVEEPTTTVPLPSEAVSVTANENDEQPQQQEETKTEAAVSAETAFLAAMRRIEDQEAEARGEVEAENLDLRWIAQVGCLVRYEAAVRQEFTAREETAEWEDLLAASRISFEEALEMDVLHAQIREAEKELLETETGIHAQEVLLAFLEKTTAETKTGQEQLATHRAALTASESDLQRVQALLRCVPPADMDTLKGTLDQLDAQIGNPSSSVEEGEGAENASRTADAGAREAALAALCKHWEDASGALEAPTTELDGLTSMPALQRCETLQERHNALVVRVTDMYSAHESTVKSVTEGKSGLTSELQRLFEKEMKALLIPRKQLQQIEDEQLHHIRRGTFVKERQVDSTTHEQLATRRIHNDHTNLCTKLVALKADIRVVQNEVRDLKRSLDDLESGKTKMRTVLQGKLDEMRSDADSFETMRVKLQEESEDLKSLRVELMKVLQYAKLQKKC